MAVKKWQQKGRLSGQHLATFPTMMTIIPESDNLIQFVVERVAGFDRGLVRYGWNTVKAALQSWLDSQHFFCGSSNVSTNIRNVSSLYYTSNAIMLYLRSHLQNHAFVCVCHDFQCAVLGAVSQSFANMS